MISEIQAVRREVLPFVAVRCRDCAHEYFCAGCGANDITYLYMLSLPIACSHIKSLCSAQAFKKPTSSSTKRFIVCLLSRLHRICIYHWIPIENITNKTNFNSLIKHMPKILSISLSFFLSVNFMLFMRLHWDRVETLKRKKNHQLLGWNMNLWQRLSVIVFCNFEQRTPVAGSYVLSSLSRTRITRTKFCTHRRTLVDSFFYSSVVFRSPILGSQVRVYMGFSISGPFSAAFIHSDFDARYIPSVCL